MPREKAPAWALRMMWRLVGRAEAEHEDRFRTWNRHIETIHESVEKSITIRRQKHRIDYLESLYEGK